MKRVLDYPIVNIESRMVNSTMLKPAMDRIKKKSQPVKVGISIAHKVLKYQNVSVISIHDFEYDRCIQQ